MGDIRYPPVRDIFICRKNNVFLRQIFRYRGRRYVFRGTLRPALKQVEIAAVMRKLDVDGSTELLFEDCEHRVYLLDKRGVAQKALEGIEQLILRKVDTHRHRLAYVRTFTDRDHLLDHRHLVAMFAE